MVKDAFNTSDKKRNALAETSSSDEKWSDGESYDSDDTDNIPHHSTTKKKRSEFNIQYGVVVHYYSFFKSHQYPTPFILSAIEVSSNQLFRAGGRNDAEDDSDDNNGVDDFEQEEANLTKKSASISSFEKKMKEHRIPGDPDKGKAINQTKELKKYVDYLD